MDLQVIGIVMSVLLGFTATITSSMVLFNLQSMKGRIDKLEFGHLTLLERKNICNQDYVGKVEYIRSSNSLEDGMKELIASVATLNGTMKMIEQMPAICGSIARNIVKEMKPNV